MYKIVKSAVEFRKLVNNDLGSFGRRPTTVYDIRGLLTLIQYQHGNVLEIGTWTGKTTYELATRFPRKTIFTIDYLENKLSDKEQNARVVREDLCKYAKDLKNVKFFYEKSSDFNYNKIRNVGTIFIDGDHSYKGVKVDSEKALEYLKGRKDGATLCWHDCLNGTFGVKKYLQELSKYYEIFRFENSQLAYIKI